MSKAPVFHMRDWYAGFMAGLQTTWNMMIPPNQMLALGLAARVALKDPKVNDEQKWHLRAFLLWCKHSKVLGPKARKLLGLDEKWLTDE